MRSFSPSRWRCWWLARSRGRWPARNSESVAVVLRLALLLLVCNVSCVYSWAVWPEVGLKSSPNVSKNAKKFLHKNEVLQISPKCWQSFGLLLLKNCYREFSKIAQSGHNARAFKSRGIVCCKLCILYEWALKLVVWGDHNRNLLQNLLVPFCLLQWSLLLL